MKLFYPLAVALALAGMTTAQSTIVGSAHDFSGTFGGGELCAPCHTPHDAGASTYPTNTVTAAL